MADTYQGQIDELKNRISVLELLLSLGMTIMVLPIIGSTHEKIYGDYNRLIAEVLGPERRTKRVRISPDKFPELVGFIKDVKLASYINELRNLGVDVEVG